MDPKLTGILDPAQSDTKYPGCLPGIILNASDPEGLGRIQVACPLIDPNKPLPNNNDGWIPMLNRSSGAGTPGGSQELLHIGDQIIMMGIMGDIKNCVGLGVLHSKVDPPSPHFDRTRGVYGSHSPNGRIEIIDENQRRSLSTFNGSTEILDSDGTRTFLSEGGGKIVVGSNGEMSLQNNGGTFTVGTDGSLVASNSLATLGINGAGEIDISIGDIPSVKFTEFGTYLNGQKDPLARNMDSLKKNAFPSLGRVLTWEPQLTSLTAQLRLANPEQIVSLIYQVDELLEIIATDLGGITLAISPLTALSSSTALELGQKVVGQIDTFRDRSLVDVLARYSGIDFDPSIIEALPQELEKLLDEKLLQGIDFPLLQQTLMGLQHNGEEQLKAVLEAISPLDQIDTVIGNELHKNLEFLQNLVRKLSELDLAKELESISSQGESALEQAQSLSESIATVTGVNPITSSASKAMVSQLMAVTSQIKNAITLLQGNIQSSQEALQKVIDFKHDFSLEQEFGSKAIDKTQELLGCIELIAPYGESVVALEQLTSNLLLLNEIDREDELKELATILLAIQQSFSTSEYSKLTIAPDETITLDNAIASSQDLIFDIGTTLLPQALANFISAVAEEMKLAFSLLKELDRNISSSTTSGGLTVDDQGAFSTSDSGNLGGAVEQSTDCAALLSPGANRGLGSKVVAKSDRAIMTSGGGDLGLASSLETSDEEILAKTPGADLGLGTWYKLNQEAGYFYGPGGEKGLGSSFFFDQETIKLCAPGGQDGVGSSFDLLTDWASLRAPGGENGSRVEVDTEQATLASPGGNRGGTKIKLTPEKIAISTAGLTGANIVMKQEEIKLAVPLLQTEAIMTQTGISLKSLSATIDLSPTQINLLIGGSGIRILPGVVLVNGVPLQFGGDLF